MFKFLMVNNNNKKKNCSKNKQLENFFTTTIILIETLKQIFDILKIYNKLIIIIISVV